MGRVIKASAVPAPAAPRAEDAAALFDGARREGFAAGHAEGTAEAALQAAVILAEARAEAARALAAVTPTAIALAARMAERIVGRAVTLDEGVLAEIAAEALATCRTDVGSLRVRVHPDQLSALEQRREWLAARAPGVAIDLVADDGVSLHGCVIDTPRGRVDARLETQLAALERALGAVEGAHG
ncbi:MAG: FliH/SctL family protein [Polyangia bacterium]